MGQMGWYICLLSLHVTCKCSNSAFTEVLESFSVKIISQATPVKLVIHATNLQLVLNLMVLAEKGHIAADAHHWIWPRKRPEPAINVLTNRDKDRVHLSINKLE